MVHKVSIIFAVFSLAVSAAEIRGPFPILSAPYHEDGALDVDTLVKEARFVADAGVNGFIWCQSNDAVDLLTLEEKKKSFAALAAAFEGRDVYVALGCEGVDTSAMVELAEEVERLAAKHPTTKILIVCRPPHDARTQEDIERYYRRLATIAKRPVIMQTYTSDKVPLPSSELLISLAREFPSIYGWIKEETGEADADTRMKVECAAPEVKTVFSAWGSWGWIRQHRTFGTRGVISERAAYAFELMEIWRALNANDDKRVDAIWKKYTNMLLLKKILPGGEHRNFSLHVLNRLGVFKNMVSREYVDEKKTPGKWKLSTRTFTDSEIAEIERRWKELREAATPKDRMDGVSGFADKVEVRSSTLCVKFDESAKGEVCSAVAHGRDYVSPVARFPLVELSCCPVMNREKRVLVTTRQAKRFAVERTANGVRLVYRDLGDAVEEVVCTVEAKDEDILWRLSAKPKPGWGIVETQYPKFALNERLGATADDDAIVMGLDNGGLLRNPMRSGREYWKERRYGRSPGALVSPFGFYFDDAGGLYTAVYDNDEYPKQLLMDRWYRHTRPDGSYKHGDFLLRWDRFNYSETSDEQPYAVVMRGLKGQDGAPTTWYDAADLYKEWAHRQKWSKVKFLDRPDLPDWAKDAPAVMGFNREWFDRPEILRKWLTDYWQKKFPGVPLIAILEGWEQHGDWVAADYFPCYPSDEKFREYCRWIKEVGGHPWPWPSGHNWNVRVGKKADGTYRLDFSKDFWERAAAHAVLQPNGKPVMKPLNWLGGGENAVMCPGDPWTINWWNKDVARALVERGADLVQADQDHNGMWTGGDCWSVKHGHPVGPGVWEPRAMRHQFETMLVEMRKVNPWAQFSFEDTNEKYNDIMAFVDYRNCRDPATEWASIFNYMYHEYVSPFQSGVEQYERPYWLAFCAVDGQVPRLPVFLSYYDLGGEVFSNGGFENWCEETGFTDWDKPERHLMSEDAATGKYSARIDAGDGKRHQLARSLRAEDCFVPGLTYRISAAFKPIKKARKGVCVNFDVAALVWKKGKPKKLGGASVVPGNGGEGWERVSKTFVMPSGAECVRFMINAWGGSEWLVDDVAVEEMQSDGSYALLKRRGSSSALAFCENWIRLYHGEGRKYLAHGKQLRPPEFRCEILPYHENFRGHEIDNVKPSVFHVLWEAQDGSRALALANATGHEQPVAWRQSDGTWRKETLEPHALKLVEIPIGEK